MYFNGLRVGVGVVKNFCSIYTFVIVVFIHIRLVLTRLVRFVVCVE